MPEGEPRMNPSNEPPSLKAWASLAEQRLQAAIDAGLFQHLPGLGKPLPDLDPNDANWWIKQKCRDEGLEVLPPALELKRKVEQALGSVEQEWKTHRDWERTQRNLEAVNRMIRETNLRIGWGPPSDVQPIDIDQWKQRLRSAPSGEPQ